MDVQQWGCAHYKNDSFCFLVTLVLSFLTLKTSLMSTKKKFAYPSVVYSFAFSLLQNN
jgi:hypothetical protein